VNLLTTGVFRLIFLIFEDSEVTVISDRRFCESANCCFKRITSFLLNYNSDIVFFHFYSFSKSYFEVTEEIEGETYNFWQMEEIFLCIAYIALCIGLSFISYISFWVFNLYFYNAKVWILSFFNYISCLRLYSILTDPSFTSELDSSSCIFLFYSSFTRSITCSNF